MAGVFIVAWARNRPPCSAVLEFRVAEAELRGGRNGLDLQGKIDEWKEVIQEFRGGPSRHFRKQMQQYDFIEGPLLFDQNLHSVFFFEPGR